MVPLTEQRILSPTTSRSPSLNALQFAARSSNLYFDALKRSSFGESRLNMIRLIAIGFASLILVACVSAEQLEAEDQARCNSTGATIDSKAYTDCRAALASQREAEERAQLRANQRNYRRHVGR